MKNGDLITTVIGIVGAAATGASPVTTAVAGKDMTSADWLQLVMAACFGILGWFTNRAKSQPTQVEGRF